MAGRPGGLVIGTIVALPLSLSSPPAAALNWDLTPRIATTVTYTDNVDLEPPGEAESDTVVELRPGFVLSADGRRTDLSFAYDLQGQYFTRQSEAEVNHQIDASANSELIKRTLFVDANLNRRQELDNLTGAVGVDNTAGSENRSTVTSASVSPYLVNRLGSFARSTLRYTYDHVSEKDREDSYSNSASWRLEEGPAFGRLTWAADARYRRVEGERDESGTFRSGSGRLGYELGRHLEISATGGYEDNDYPSGDEDLSGSFWDVGVRWVPSHRTEAEVRYGERYFGETASVRIQHRRRHAVLSVSYSESITTDRRDRLVADNRVPVYQGCTPENDPNCQPVGEIVVFEIESANEFFIQRRGVITMTLIGNRQSLTLAGYRSENEYQLRERTTTQTGATASWSWDLGSRSDVGLSGGWSRNEFSDLEREDNLYNASATYSQELGARLRSFLTLRHQRRESDESTAEYRENAAIVGLSASF